MADLTSRDAQLARLSEAEASFPATFKEEVLIKHLTGSLFFGFTSEFHALAAQIPSTATHVILRMDAVPCIDQSGLYALKDVLLDLERNTILIAPEDQPLAMMSNTGLVPSLVPEEMIFTTFEDCIAWLPGPVVDQDAAVG